MAATTALLTAEKAVSNAPHGRWELVRGEVATYMPVQPEQARCVQRLGTKVEVFLEDPESAVMGPEIGFIVAQDPDTVRAPDWSFTWLQEAQVRRRGAWIEGGPNIAAEVVSPDDAWFEVQTKVDEYLAAGTALVWVIDPEMRTVHVFRPDTPMAVLRVDDSLDGSPVLPSFTLPVAELFPVTRLNKISEKSFDISSALVIYRLGKQFRILPRRR